jgi:hypothetical protein
MTVHLQGASARPYGFSMISFARANLKHGCGGGSLSDWVSSSFGHFPAMEAPDLLVQDLRALFGSYR